MSDDQTIQAVDDEAFAAQCDIANALVSAQEKYHLNWHDIIAILEVLKHRTIRFIDKEY